MSSTDAGTETEESTEVVDEARSALLEAIQADFGSAVVDSHLIAGRDLWIRVANDAWGDTADYLHNRQRFRLFDWLSAIDWMPSPFGRSHDAAVDVVPTDPAAADAADGPTAEQAAAGSMAGGETRFQVFARVHNLSTGLGITIKADVGGEDLSIPTWIHEYPGASWHEREAHEMFGIHFEGHPDLRNLYLPTGFEGHPLRKDFPLLSRLVKPWPGIVDVEPMPVIDDESDSPGNPTSPEGPGDSDEAGTSRNPEDSQ